MKKNWSKFCSFTEDWIFDTPLAYLPIFLLFFACFFPAFRESQRVEEEQNRIMFRQLPDMTALELKNASITLFEKMRALDASDPKAPPEKVFVLVDESVLLEQIYQKHIGKFGRWKNPDFENLLDVEKMLTHGASISPFIQSQVVRLQKQLRERFRTDEETFERARAIWRSNNPTVEIPEVPSRTWSLIGLGYLWSIPVMALFFSMKLYRKEQLHWIESYRIAIASMLWPVCIWVYPIDQERKEQLKQALQVVCYAQSILLSLCGFGGIGGISVAKAQTAKSQNSGEMSKKKRTPRATIGMETYRGSGGLEDGLLVSPWYSFGQKVGTVNLSFFGFVEVGKRRPQQFTNHTVTASHSRLPWLGVRTEVGGSLDKKFFIAGPKVNFHQMPGIRKIIGSAMQSVAVARYGRIRGSGSGPEEFVFYWGTKSLSTPIAGVSIDGFHRVRPGPQSNVGQSRIVLRPKGWSHATMNYEVWFIGTRPTHRVGLEFNFSF